MVSQFSDAYAEIQTAIAGRNFSEDKEWKAFIAHARKLLAPTGFDVGEAGSLDDLRKMLAKVDGKASSEAANLYRGAGEGMSGTGPVAAINGDLGKRLGALKTLRHTYLSKRWGGHKEWIVSIPDSFSDWPTDAVKGGLGAVTALLNDKNEHFSAETRKHLKDASQDAVRWLQKAQIVVTHQKKKDNLALVARWFADSTTTDAQAAIIASKLNVGLKKIIAKIKSGNLIYTDSVSERGTTANAGTEAFFWNDTLNVVYIEDEFFGTRNTLTGATNWTRILIHEITHMVLATEDHAYEHQAMAPAVLGAARCLENADSWAWFCADCGGALTDGQIKNALARR